MVNHTRKRIIIADDVSALKIQERILESFPIDVEKYSNGKALHERLESVDPTNPDFHGLITDNCFGNGYFGSEMALSLRERGFKGPIRVQSSIYDQDLLDRLDKNDIDFFEKPFEVPEYETYLKAKHFL